MKIYPINFQSTKCAEQSTYGKIKNSSFCDVSFSGMSAEKRAFISALRKIKTNPEIRKVSEYIASGSEGSVYKMRGFDYCIKILHEQYNGLIGKWSTHISDAQKCNHIVAISRNGTVAMKYIPGSSKPTPQIFSLPKSSFKGLLKQINAAYKQGLRFDASRGNVVFNESENTLTAIDFYRPSIISVFEKKFNNPFQETFSALQYTSADGMKYNKKLLGILLDVMLDEVQTPKSELLIRKEDILKMFSTFEKDQKKSALPQNYEKLKALVSDVLEDYEKQQLPGNQPGVAETIQKIASAGKIIRENLLNS